MSISFTAIFDIGKTNKKFFLFDEQLNVKHQESKVFEEIADDDGFPCDDLDAIVSWIKLKVEETLDDPTYELIKLNFSTYGASLVHLDEKGKRVTPFYNYLKPVEGRLSHQLFSQYGDREDFAATTSSPIMGMLNSGFQLYYLKYAKPELFAKIRCSLHLPQYLSSIFTAHYLTDYTSIGCHTCLWDYQKSKYHPWLSNEGVINLLQSPSCSDIIINIEKEGRAIECGIGVHDSSAALLPYQKLTDEPFVLLSTGTWNICMNPFNQDVITTTELKQDCLNFLNPKGQSVKASRLFLGHELSVQLERLASHFGKGPDYFKQVEFDSSLVEGDLSNQLSLDLSALEPERFGLINGKSDLSSFHSFEVAYHQLVNDLCELQTASLMLAIGSSPIKTIYIDGGFADNEVFVKMLETRLPQYEVETTAFANGTALGAAMLVQG